MDNVSSNDVLVAALSRILREKFSIQFVPENSQIRCLAHVVNLVVQKILATFNEAENPTDDDYYAHNKDVPLHYDPEQDPDQLELDNEVFSKPNTREATDSDDEAANDSDSDGDADSGGLDMEFDPDLLGEEAEKLQNLTVLQKASRISRNFLELTTFLALTHDDQNMFPRLSGGTCSAIGQWVARQPALRPLLLTADDWKLLDNLHKILHPFTKVTLQMSKSSTPTLPWVIPMYEKMLEHLREHVSNNDLSLSLREAVGAGLTKLEEYYEKACGCQFNVIATVLHPSLGLSWFGKYGEERKNQAKILFTHAYDSYKKIYDNEMARTKRAARAQQPTQPSSFLDNICAFDNEDMDETLASELDLFFAAFRTHGRGERDAPLVWWKEYAYRFPVVARMARDFLAIPGTSVSVEHLFSRSRHLCHEARGSMKAETITQAILTKMRIKAGYLEY
ncbi:Dimer-Tnp-hAT domain-containing protein [Mycena sanguinolenta]|uniref:Dimer-Tnp-hAT domain-containing protein n=1 Tax=Mycena sanguinolenta TaxID=230812 RepID=A0A8H6YMA3_9AGAR|nr:Dimer-Tnp-hAT domain-containing protein [Mycena sanguinolenta]